MFNFFTTSPPSKSNNDNNVIEVIGERRSSAVSELSFTNSIISKFLPSSLQISIGNKLDYFLTNERNKKKVLDVCIQSTKVLKRFVNNVSYLWVVYDDSLELLSCKNDISDYDVKSTFQINYDNYGNYQKFQCIDTRDDECTFLSFHFIKGKVYNILPLDTRYVLYFAEKV